MLYALYILIYTYIYLSIHIYRSQRYTLWNRYRVKKPRVPVEEDKSRLVEDNANSPKTFSTFVGTHNTPTIQQLSQLLELFETIKSFPEVLALCGPSGSGKSSLAGVFVNGLLDAVSYKPSQAKHWCLTLDANLYKADMNKLWDRVNKFAEAPMERWQVLKYRLVVIDNFQVVTPSSQQVLKRTMERFANTLKYLFICPDAVKCLTTYVLNKVGVCCMYVCMYHNNRHNYTVYTY
jgi:chromosomal replication initiation ATPase DnaA